MHLFCCIAHFVQLLLLLLSSSFLLLVAAAAVVVVDSNQLRSSIINFDVIVLSYNLYIISYFFTVEG